MQRATTAAMSMGSAYPDWAMPCTNWRKGTVRPLDEPGMSRAVADREEALTAISRLLLERVRADKYPSATYMEILEQTLPPEMTREYVNVLLEKVITDRTPSIQMLRRIQRIAASL